MAWGSSADREFRLVLAYRLESGHELGIFSEGGPGLVATRNTLYGPHDLSGVQVTSHQGVLLVGGPVSDAPVVADGCHVWLCDDPDWGEGAWAQVDLAPPPVALTHQVDGAGDWWWVGHDGLHITVWHEDTGVTVIPDVIVDCPGPRAFLASAPYGETAPTLATQTGEGSFVRWLDEGQWRKAPLPGGQLQGALRSPRVADPAGVVPQRLHLVVDSKAWWMDWEDVRRLGR